MIIYTQQMCVFQHKEKISKLYIWFYIIWNKFIRWNHLLNLQTLGIEPNLHIYQNIMLEINEIFI